MYDILQGTPVSDSPHLAREEPVGRDQSQSEEYPRPRRQTPRRGRRPTGRATPEKGKNAKKLRRVRVRVSPGFLGRVKTKLARAGAGSGSQISLNRDVVEDPPPDKQPMPMITGILEGRPEYGPSRHHGIVTCHQGGVSTRSFLPWNCREGDCERSCASRHLSSAQV